MNPLLKRALSEATLAGLTLSNRVIKAATFEGMSPGGRPTSSLTEHHQSLAQGGVGLTTVAYCAVTEEGRTFGDQMVMDERLCEELTALTEAVHRTPGRVSLQLGHCGGFSKDKNNLSRRPKGPIAPTSTWNRYGLLSGIFRSREMTEHDIEGVIDAFGRAAELSKSAGFDALELHLGHGYLLSQFLSPALNRRKDDYGGSLDNRLRLPLRVIERVRQSVGPDFPILAKVNLRDHLRGGLEPEESLAISQALEEQRGGADALVMSGGLVSHSAFYLMRGQRPLKQMIEVEKSMAQRWALRLFGRSVIEEIPFEELFFLELAKEHRKAVKLPLALLGGIIGANSIETAMQEGFDFVVMGRALLHNPELVSEISRGRKQPSECTHCNHCVAEMDRDGVRCVLEPSQEPPPLAEGL